jgi:hypothetical protein
MTKTKTLVTLAATAVAALTFAACGSSSATPSTTPASAAKVAEATVSCKNGSTVVTDGVMWSLNGVPQSTPYPGALDACGV